MKKLPVIVGFGGINSAGRSAMHHAHKRMVYEALSPVQLASTWTDLATLMGLDRAAEDTQERLLSGTLIRHVEQNHFDPGAVAAARKASLDLPEPISFRIKKTQLPEHIPPNWTLREHDLTHMSVTVSQQFETILPDSQAAKVSSAGQLPRGFDPGSYYNSAHHPRGLQMAVYGASDAIRSIGIDWSTIVNAIAPDQVSVYAGSAISQLDQFGLKGLYQSGFNGKRTTSKMMPLTLPEMAADFVNSYMINSVGNTGSNTGACATFLYNLRQGIIDLQSGQCRVAIVGNSEAPVVPEIMEGFRVMGALAEDDQLKALDQAAAADHRRACRPFSSNAGFTIAESAQFLILMDDALAMELGATAFGSIADVFVNADANKKSISGPGIGNYITMAKATALARAILAEDVQRTFVMAHGTGTPQNRVTESHILNEIASSFGINNWAVAAIKAYVGHSLGPAAADQIVAALGVWDTGFIPGIKTIDHVADDVHQANLDILLDHRFAGDKGAELCGALINSKGFGGNNASALLLSPQKTHELMQARHGAADFTHYLTRNEKTRVAQVEQDEKTCAEGLEVIYSFGKQVMNEADVGISTDRLSLSQFRSPIQLATKNPFID